MIQNNHKFFTARHHFCWQRFFLFYLLKEKINKNQISKNKAGCDIQDCTVIFHFYSNLDTNFDNFHLLSLKKQEKRERRKYKVKTKLHDVFCSSLYCVRLLSNETLALIKLLNTLWPLVSISPIHSSKSCILFKTILTSSYPFFLNPHNLSTPIS